MAEQSLFTPMQGGPVPDGQVTPDQYARLLKMLGHPAGKQLASLMPQSTPGAPVDDPTQPALQPEPTDPNGETSAAPPPAPQSVPGKPPKSLADITGDGRLTGAKVARAIPLPTSSQIDPAITSQLSRVIDEQEKGIGESQKNLDLYRALSSQGQSIAPLLGLVDAYTGSHLSKDYQAPDSPEQRLETIAKLQNFIQGQRGNVSKDISTLALGDLRNNDALYKGMMAMAMANDRANAMMNRYQMTPPWRADSIMMRAADAVHKAPNIKLYTDMANSVAETNYLLNKPDVTITEAHEALQNLSRAIGRVSQGSDYRQKQLDMPTVQEAIGRASGMLQSNPNQAAPPDMVRLVKKISNRVLDTYGASIAREANRVTQGRHFALPEAQQAMEEARDFYASGQYMKNLRDQYGLTNSEIAPGENSAASPTAAPGAPPPIPSYQEWKAKQGKRG